MKVSGVPLLVAVFAILTVEIQGAAIRRKRQEYDPALAYIFSNGIDIAAPRRNFGLDWLNPGQVTVGQNAYYGALGSGWNDGWNVDGGILGGGFKQRQSVPIFGLGDVFGIDRNYGFDVSNMQYTGGLGIGAGPFPNLFSSTDTVSIPLVSNVASSAVGKEGIFGRKKR